MKKNKMNLFYLMKYMITYLIIISVFIVLLSHLYLQFQKLVRDDALDKSYSKLKNGVSVVDAQISEMYRFASLIRATDEISEISKINKSLDVDEYYILNKARNRLHDMKSMHELKYSVFFKKNNLFVSNEIMSDNYENEYGLYSDYGDLSPNALKQQVFSDKMNITYIPSQKIKYMDSDAFDALTCVVKMPVNPSLSYDCAVLFLMDENDIINTMLDEIAMKNGFLYITDGNGNILMDYNYKAKPLGNSGEMEDIHRINGQKYYVFSEKATYGNITAVAGISQVAFDNELVSVLRIIQFYIFAAVFIAMLACLLFAFRQASFVKGIIDVFSFRKKNHPRLINEYGYIKATIQEISEEYLKKVDDIKSLQESVRSCLMEKMLLHGVFEANEKQIVKEYIGDTDCFCVVCIHSDAENEEQCLALFIKIEEMFENRYQLIPIQNGTTEMNLLVKLNPEETTDMDNILKFAENLTKQFNSITISVSGIGFGIENIHVCYLQTKNMLRQIFDPSERFVCFRKNYVANVNKVFDANIAGQLSELITAGQKEEIGKIFDKIKRNARTNVMEDEQEIMQLFFDIKSPLNDIYINILKSRGEITTPQYSSTMSLNEMIVALEEFAVQMCSCISEIRKSKKDELKFRVVEYLQNNYDNPMMCAALTADEFSISEKYVFSVVKEGTGKTFNEYIEGLRLEKAKEYLKNTDISVKKIASMVGFNTIDTFYKSFKRVHGIAPGKWKENNGGKK